MHSTVFTFKSVYSLLPFASLHSTTAIWLISRAKHFGGSFLEKCCGVQEVMCAIQWLVSALTANMAKQTEKEYHVQKIKLDVTVLP